MAAGAQRHGDHVLLTPMCYTTIVFRLRSRKCSSEGQFLVYKVILLQFLWEKLLSPIIEMIGNLSPTALGRRDQWLF